MFFARKIGGQIGQREGFAVPADGAGGADVQPQVLFFEPRAQGVGLIFGVGTGHGEIDGAQLPAAAVFAQGKGAVADIDAVETRAGAGGGLEQIGDVPHAFVVDIDVGADVFDGEFFHFRFAPQALPGHADADFFRFERGAAAAGFAQFGAVKGNGGAGKETAVDALVKAHGAVFAL